MLTAVCPSCPHASTDAPAAIRTATQPALPRAAACISAVHPSCTCANTHGHDAARYSCAHACTRAPPPQSHSQVQHRNNRGGQCQGFQHTHDIPVTPAVPAGHGHTGNPARTDTARSSPGTTHAHLLRTHQRTRPASPALAAALRPASLGCRPQRHGTPPLPPCTLATPPPLPPPPVRPPVPAVGMACPSHPHLAHLH